MDSAQPRFLGLAAKTIVCHTITYIVMGFLAAYFLDYAAVLSHPNSLMRPINDPWVMAGPLFQPLRGLIFALVFYPLREILFGKKYGWLLMAWMLIALGILSTFGAVSGSIEGMIYTVVPIRVPAERLAGNHASSPAAFRAALLLGQPPCEEVAELAARDRFPPDDGIAGFWLADAQGLDR